MTPIMDSAEIRECPMCGSDDVTVDVDVARDNVQFYSVICLQCGVNVEGNSREQVITAWNTRAAVKDHAPAVDGWLPMSDLPDEMKDGRDVQLWSPEGWSPEAHYCASKKGWYTSYWDADWQSYSESAVYTPSHWQPLPPPPTTLAGEKV